MEVQLLSFLPKTLDERNNYFCALIALSVPLVRIGLVTGCCRGEKIHDLLVLLRNGGKKSCALFVSDNIVLQIIQFHPWTSYFELSCIFLPEIKTEPKKLKNLS
jgi:hypothetical protein